MTIRPGVLGLVLLCACPAMAADGATVFEAYKGAVGKRAKFTMLLRRDVGTLSGFYFYDAIKIDIPLGGILATDGTFVLTERDAKGNPSATFRGTLAGDHLSGHWIDSTGAKGPPSRDLPFSADRTVSSVGMGMLVEQSYDGLLGDKHPIRMALASKGGRLSGYYRYRRSRDDLKLAGDVSANGEFHLVESNARGRVTGSFVGLLVPGLRVFGEWSSPARNRTLPVHLRLSRTAIRRIIEIKPGIRLVPRESTVDDKSCDVSGLYYELAGLDDHAVAKRINGTLKDLADKHSECAPSGASDDPGSFESYAVSKAALFGKFLVFWQDLYSDEGGAHPTVSSESLVFDTTTGSTVDLMTYVKPEKATAFSHFVHQKIIKEADDPDDIYAEANIVTGHLYPTGNGLSIVFSPSEVAAYVIGFVETTLSPHQAGMFFQMNSDTHALFGF